MSANQHAEDYFPSLELDLSSPASKQLELSEEQWDNTKKKFKTAFEALHMGMGVKPDSENKTLQSCEKNDSNAQCPGEFLMGTVSTEGTLGQKKLMQKMIVQYARNVTNNMANSKDTKHTDRVREILEWLDEEVKQQMEHFKAFDAAAFEAGQASATRKVAQLQTEIDDLNDRISHYKVYVKRLDEQEEALKKQEAASSVALTQSAAGGNADGVSASAPESGVILNALDALSSQMRDLKRNMTKGFNIIQAAQAGHTEQQARMLNFCTGEQSGSGEEEETQSDEEGQVPNRADTADDQPKAKRHKGMTAMERKEEHKTHMLAVGSYPQTWALRPCDSCGKWINNVTHELSQGKKSWRNLRCEYRRDDQLDEDCPWFVLPFVSNGGAANGGTDGAAAMRDRPVVTATATFFDPMAARGMTQAFVPQLP